jgi:uncharacterized low-complexity protein
MCAWQRTSGSRCDRDSLRSRTNRAPVKLSGTACRRVLTIIRRSHSLAHPAPTQSPGSPYARIAGATICVRAAAVKREPRSEERATEGKSIEGKALPEERATEGKPIEGKALPEERATEGKSIEGKALPEERAMEGKSIEGKALPEERVMEGKSIAAKREGVGSYEAARAGKSGPTEVAAAKGRSSKAAGMKAATTKAATATKAAVNSRRTQGRGGRGNRRGGQSSHYVAHHDASPFIRRRTPAFKYETRQFPLSCSRAALSLGHNSPAPRKRQ